MGKMSAVIFATELFAGDRRLESELQRRLSAATRAAEHLGEDEAFAIDEVDWLDREFSKRMIPLLELDKERVFLEEAGAGRNIVLVIPFRGEADLFDFDPRTRKDLLRGGREVGPHAYVGENDVRMILTISPGTSASADEAARQRLELLQRWVDRVNWQLRNFERELSKTLKEAIRKRREEVERHREYLAKSSIPVRRRGDAPRVFREEPVVRRPVAIRPTANSATTEARAGPVLSTSYYEHIVDVIRAAANAMTRAPATYAGWSEHDRRQALILILNTHYEGQAHGEAFNGLGKTDILIRVEDENVFIAECSFWAGKSSVRKKLDQLLRYATWHDTKLALVLFVRRDSLTTAIKDAQCALEEHSSFLCWVNREREADWRCRIRLRGDPQRGALLHVFLVHTPEVNRERLEIERPTTLQ